MPVPSHLHINDRDEDQSFDLSDLLYHGYSEDEYDWAEDIIKVETIRFPDFSCNWNRYSEPNDIKYRINGVDTDGCYSFSVVVSRFKNLATPVHDPIEDEEYPNYSHVEIRVLRTTDPTEPGFIPPKRRKFNNQRLKFEYRQNIANKLAVEIEARTP